MNKSETFNRRQFLRMMSGSLAGLFTASIIPSVHHELVINKVQESSRTKPDDPVSTWTPTPGPQASLPAISQEEIQFLATHELIRGDTSRKVVMMSYDDVMDNVRLTHLLDVYQEYSVKTTFFIIGKDLDTCKETLPRIISDGHDLGCHGWSHDAPLTSLSDKDLDLQFGQYLYKIHEYLPDYRVHYFRAPFGARNQRVRDIGASWGMRHVLWSLESGGQDKQTYHNVIDRVTPGEIVLSHETRYFDVNDADVIVRELVRKGYSLENMTTGMAKQDQWNGPQG
jgi:peptidoglycan/xylan/chitin deacetylase (PgdA/CDA1 family)